MKKTMTTIRRAFLALVLVLLAVSFASGALAKTGAINVITIKGTINPVLVDYVLNAIQQAEETGAQALVIQMDTPGGLDSAMRDIIQGMVNARVPVVVYVAPSGARAASAGTYILMASHVAVMAPNTVIGAAHPVSIGNDQNPTPAQPASAEDEKVLNDAAAYIRTLATSHGRNADWAEKAVRESVSATESEALDLNVIDMVAADLPSLVAQLDGRQVTLMNGQVVTLNTKGTFIIDVPMGTVQKFLYTIADPNIAYILLSVAMLGIMAEIFSPGLIFPGIVGGVCLLLAFYALGMLPVNYAGILFIVLAFGLFVGEVLTPGFGLFTAGGIICLIIGSLLLFKGAPPIFRVSPWLIATVCILLGGSIAFILHRTISIHRRQATTGREELVGKVALVKVALRPSGMVFYRGENWTAVSENGEVKVGDEVVIDRMEGLTLFVRKKQA